MTMLRACAWLLILAGSVTAAEIGHPRKVTLARVPDGGIQPQIAMDEKGAIQLIYFKGDPGNGDLYYARSRDGGATFSKAVRVNSVPGSAVATGNIRGARIAVGKNGRVHVAWNGSHALTPGPPMARSLCCTRGSMTPERLSSRNAT